jgi:hypothetical protein
MLQTRKTSAVPVAVAGVGGARPLPRPSNYLDPSVASPARSRQELIEAAWRERAAQPGRRWSPRATLAFSGGAALLLWGMIGLAIHAAVR